MSLASLTPSGIHRRHQSQRVIGLEGVSDALIAAQVPALALAAHAIGKRSSLRIGTGLLHGLQQALHDLAIAVSPALVFTAEETCLSFIKSEVKLFPHTLRLIQRLTTIKQKDAQAWGSLAGLQMGMTKEADMTSGSNAVYVFALPQ